MKLLLLLLMAGLLSAQTTDWKNRECGEVTDNHPVGIWWKASVAIFVAIQAADAATSYGYQEANPIYGQRFGARGIALKTIITVAVPLVEHKIMRHHPSMKRAFIAANFGLTGATTRAVIYNARDMASTPAPIGITPSAGTVTVSEVK